MVIEEEEESIQHSNCSANSHMNEQLAQINKNIELYSVNQSNLNEYNNTLTFPDLNNSLRLQQSHEGMNNETLFQQKAFNKQQSLKKSKKGILGVFENQSSQNNEYSSAQKLQKFKSFWHIRFSKDYQEILKQNLNDENCLVCVCEPQYYNSHIKLRVLLQPLQGVFSGATIRIYFIVTKDYPYKPVLAFAEEYIFHPNINNNTKQIYWKILDDREWKPTLTLYFIILQLKFAFIEPDLTFVPNNIENVQCAELFQCNQQEFRRKFEIFYQSNDTSSLEKDLSNKMNLEDNHFDESEREYGTLNQLDYQYISNQPIQNNLTMTSQNQNHFVNQQNQLHFTGLKNQNNFQGFQNIDQHFNADCFESNLKMFEPQPQIYQNINCYGGSTTLNKNNPFSSSSHFENISEQNQKDDSNQNFKCFKSQPQISNFDNQTNKNMLDVEYNNFENHLNIAFQKNQTNSNCNIFENNFINFNSNNNNNINTNNYMNNYCSSMSSSSSSASVEHDNHQKMEDETNNFKQSTFNKLRILTNHLSLDQGNKLQSNETALTPTLRRERDESIRNQFIRGSNEPLVEDQEEVLLSGDSTNNQSNYLLIQNPFNSTKEQSFLITSQLNTTSCQMHPKKRKYQHNQTQDDSNTFDLGKQNKLV
ncbi:hypothetical protein ABPG74_011413 [Tetrahymena malaccensis]